MDTVINIPTNLSATSYGFVTLKLSTNVRKIRRNLLIEINLEHITEYMPGMHSRIGLNYLMCLIKLAYHITLYFLFARIIYCIMILYNASDSAIFENYYDIRLHRETQC